MAEETQPYINYNKQDDVPTLVGNWVEERHLKDMTGITRNMVSMEGLMTRSSATSSPRHAWPKRRLLPARPSACRHQHKC